MVSVRTVFELPLLKLSVPLVATSAGLSDFNMIDRTSPLSFVDKSTALNSIIEHLLTDSFFKRQS